MAFLGQVLIYLVKAILLIGAMVGGVFAGKKLRDKKDQKKAKQA